MIVTELSLVEYYDKIIPRAIRQGYKWIISVIARHADAKILYDTIEQDWASINDLTYDNILFVFSIEPILENNSFFHTEGEENYVGTMCPYVQTINEDRIANNRGDFWIYTDKASNIDWKQKHSQSITEFIRKYHIMEEELPVLFIWNLKKDRYSVVSLNENEEMYLFLKKCLLEQEKLVNQRQALEKDLYEFKQLQMYFNLYDSLENRAMNFEKIEATAIKSVLDGRSTYLEKKDQIKDKIIRKDLKRIGQWKKQFFTDTKDVLQVRNHVDDIAKKIADIELRMDEIWENASVNDKAFFQKLDISQDCDIVSAVVSICSKLISDDIYYGASENSRNTFIRELLDERGYEVRDQTRQGLSAEGKDAGEIDICILGSRNRRVIIEGLNLKCMNRKYIDKHLDKIFGYDTLGNEANIILNYITVSHFMDFLNKYISYMKERNWKYPLVSIDEKCEEFEISYSSIRVLKTIHERNGKNTCLYHICALIK